MKRNKRLLLLFGIILIVFCFGMLIETTFNILEFKEQDKNTYKDTVIDLTKDIGVILELQRQGILESVDNIKFENFKIFDGRYYLEVKK
ncbi:MAG TPA: hypothetical protein VIK14_16925 [Ignavibacteria bacterium]